VGAVERVAGAAEGPELVRVPPVRAASSLHPPLPSPIFRSAMAAAARRERKNPNPSPPLSARDTVNKAGKRSRDAAPLYTKRTNPSR